MKQQCVFLVGFLLFWAAALPAAELLIGDEQSFETSSTPGRWAAFAWPDSSSEPYKPPPMGGGGEHATGDPVVLGQASDAPSGFGASCLLINWGGTEWSTGGVMITLDVVNGSTYTITAHYKFDDDNDYRAACGMTVDTDGGTNPSQAEYGVRDTVTLVSIASEFDINRGAVEPAYLTGEWAWNATWMGSNAGQWWGSPEITLDIAATGDRMTIFLWGSFKQDIDIKIDGVSVQGPVPVPPTPSTGIEEWNVYR